MKAAIALLVVILSGSTGCRFESRTADSALKVQLGAEPVSLDPAFLADGYGLRVLANVMEGLVGYDGVGKLVNRLASDYRITKNGKTLEFTIRKDASWSDGKPVTVQDFVTGIRRTLDPKTGSQQAEMLYPIKSANDVKGKLVIELERPAPYFIKALTQVMALPIRQDILDRNGGKWPETAPSTGPYYIEKHIPGEKIILKKNIHYWEKLNSNAPDRIELLIIPGESTGVNLFESGKLDVLSRLPPLDIKRLGKKNRIYSAPFAATYYIAFNTKKAPFQEIRWRQSVAKSIRAREIVKLMETGDTPAFGIIPPDVEGYIPYSKDSTSSDFEWAKSQGYEAPVVSAFNSGEINSLILEKIQNDVKEKTGLMLSLTNMDWKSYVNVIHSDPPPIFRYAWQVPFIDPIILLQNFTTGSLNNTTGWSNKNYDRLVDQVSSMESGPKREEIIRRAQKILIDDAVIVPIYHYVQSFALSPRISNFHVNPLGVTYFNEIQWAQK